MDVTDSHRCLAVCSRTKRISYHLCTPIGVECTLTLNPSDLGGWNRLNCRTIATTRKRQGQSDRVYWCAREPKLDTNGSRDSSQGSRGRGTTRKGQVQGKSVCIHLPQWFVRGLRCDRLAEMGCRLSGFNRDVMRAQVRILLSRRQTISVVDTSD